VADNGHDGRQVLPIPDRAYPGTITYDAKDPDTSFPAIEPLRPPKGAPNILIVLLDDTGFGASSAFGGPVETPTAERLAAGGLKYNRFHTTALCSPSRQALLTGRNHHSVGMGGITEIATSAPGYTSVRPNTAAPIAEMLKLNGYSTAQFGKCHEVPVWETSSAGPFDRWPTGSGFEHFYGFIGGEAHQFYPALYEGTKPVEPDKTPGEGYHLTEDLTDKAIAWARQQKALAGDKPFFMYFAPGATHAPHHVPKEWIEKYKGHFDQGWDRLREETIERQKVMGVIPRDTELTRRHEEIPAWDDMPDELKPVLIRQMECYAAMLDHTDHHVGRLIDAIDELGVLGDTLVYYIVGDNGASAEGTINGTFNEMINFNGAAALETPEFMLSKLDDFGGPDSYNHFSVGWAHAMDAPLQWTKQVASHFGGTRNGTIVHWPNGMAARGEVREQFHHLIDIAPTLLEVAGIPAPLSVNGVQQMPLHGVSMVYSFDGPTEPDRHETQYFEMFGNRGVYHKGWTAVTKHKTPWELVGGNMVAFDDDVWELYDTRTDWSQARDLASEQPERLHELQRLWLIEAVRYGVLPIDDRAAERLDAGNAGRPTLIQGDSQVLYGGMSRLSESSVVSIKNKSHSVTAEVEVPEDGASGVIVAQGGSVGGWALYAHEGRLKYCYNLFGLKSFYVDSNGNGDAAIAAGQHQVRMEFDYDGGGLAKGGTVSLYLDGDKLGEGRVDATAAMIFSADDTLDVGEEGGALVTEDYGRDNAFSGRVNWVQIDLSTDDGDHVVTDDERVRVAMARQ
jgi:arylsulfatase A-like enzyme